MNETSVTLADRNEYFYLRSRYGYWKASKDWCCDPTFGPVPKLYRDYRMAEDMAKKLKRRTGLDIQIYSCILEA